MSTGIFMKKIIKKTQFLCVLTAIAVSNFVIQECYGVMTRTAATLGRFGNRDREDFYNQSYDDLYGRSYYERNRYSDYNDMRATNYEIKVKNRQLLDENADYRQKIATYEDALRIKKQNLD